jgi:hypothetical protein
MELARPARDAVVVRVSTVCSSIPFFAHGGVLGSLRGLQVALVTAGIGPERR